MNSPRTIGHIVAVQGFRVKVELLPDTKSAMRATLDGVQTAVAINAYLTFAIGAGQAVIGIITDLESRESYDPTEGDELSLELLKSRRIANIQLLGTIGLNGDSSKFTPGITVLPTLDTPAEVSSPRVLKAVLETPPQRNKPDDHDGQDFDFDLKIGSPTGQPANVVKASYNDLFSRPLAIVGNTGSGKSYSVSSLIQNAISSLHHSGTEPHVFILDINGEYGRAFPGTKTSVDRKPDHIYLNDDEFGIPLWFLNATEICGWLSASEQTQEPVLKDWWAIIKAKNAISSSGPRDNSIRHAINKASIIIQTLDAPQKPYKKVCCQQFKILKDYLSGQDVPGLSELRTALLPHYTQYSAVGTAVDWNSPDNEVAIRLATETLIENLRALITNNIAVATQSATTADSPRFIPKSKLVDPTFLDHATPHEDAARIEAHLTTLKLRLKSRLDDPRWQSFLNYESEVTSISSLVDWMHRLGFGNNLGSGVSVIDLSMLSHEVLPFACSVIGRVLLEARENLPAASRYKHPWVLVLEEAHNYARPPRMNEDRGQVLSRLAFERIAKEGRKFGLSLIIASQRPSEISPTIISQCANFISHRLQNPEDIEHFRRIIPIQARRLLDQVTILSSGEAIVFGSAFHIPMRVQFDMPSPGPYSQTAAPYFEWSRINAQFPLESVLDSWGLSEDQKSVVNENTQSMTSTDGNAAATDDLPF